MGRLMQCACPLKNSPPVSTDLAALLHELSQPLTAILSNAQAAQRFLSNAAPDQRAELQDILADIVAHDKKAAALVSKLKQAIQDMEADGMEGQGR
jgi:C4-dicarboxylate-specific signal transduction histidine kinase